MESDKINSQNNCRETASVSTTYGNIAETPGKLSNSIRRQLRRKRAKHRLHSLENSSTEKKIQSFESQNIVPKVIGVQPKLNSDLFDFSQLLGKKHDPNLNVQGDSLVISSKLTKKIEQKRTSRIGQSIKNDETDTIKNPNETNSVDHSCLDVSRSSVENVNAGRDIVRQSSTPISKANRKEISINPYLGQNSGDIIGNIVVDKLDIYVDAEKHWIQLKTENEKNITTKMSDQAVKDRAAVLAEREAKKLAKKSKKTISTTDNVVKNESNKSKQNNSSSNQCVDQVDFVQDSTITNIPTNKDTKKDDRRRSLTKSQVGSAPPLIPIESNKKLSTVMVDYANQINKILVGKAKQENLTDDSKHNLEKNEEGKSKAEIRAERRAKQEAQRAAKTNAAIKKTTETQPKTFKTVQEKKIAAPPSLKQSITPSIIKKSAITSLQHKAQILFNHLYVDRDQRTAHVTDIDGIHPAMIRIGKQYQNGVIYGSNSRCIAMLMAIRDMIKDFKTPTQAEYARSLETTLKKCVQYLHSCRPISVSMTNALRFFKYQLTLLPNNVTDDEAASILTDAIQTYIKEQIEMAGQAISITVQPKIINGDTILIYGCSSLIKHILLDAHNSGKNFRVVVVDSRPFLEGKEMLRQLVAAGIKCTYVLIATTSFIMASVSKVLLGAHALLANGYVMSRTGTAQVALMAKAHNVPVLVCCETYKFCERVQTDSFVYNEIADPDRLLKNKNEETNESDTSVIPLSLTYDVTPSDLVTAVVTELAILPCTSVPVILRIKPTDSSY